MLGFCQGKDDLEHNKQLADKFFSELQAIEASGSYYVASINRHFRFEIIYVMDMKAQWCVCDNGGASYIVRFFCNHCPCRPESRHFESYLKCGDCVRRAIDRAGKICRHHEEWTEDMIKLKNQMIIDQPWKAHWAFVFPKSSSKAEEWKLFAKQVLNLSVGPNPSGEKCKDEVRKVLRQ
jgi:hypothetical protein